MQSQRRCILGIMAEFANQKERTLLRRRAAGYGVSMKIRVFIVAILLILDCGAFGGRSCAQAPATETQRKTSEPYTGNLSIFESPGRDHRLQVERVMDVLQLGPGKHVADIGAGSGWFTVRAAKRVGGLGMVYAVDINPEAERYIMDRARKEKLDNVKAVLSTPDDPKLPADSIDAVLLLKTYHEVAHPVTLLRNLRASLRPGARVGVIDRSGNGEDHGINKDVVIGEAKEAGYRLSEQYDFVKGDNMDYFLVFTAAE
jgi:SAM-dependent methyltransferase